MTEYGCPLGSPDDQEIYNSQMNSLSKRMDKALESTAQRLYIYTTDHHLVPNNGPASQEERGTLKNKIESLLLNKEAILKAKDRLNHPHIDDEDPEIG